MTRNRIARQCASVLLAGLALVGGGSAVAQSDQKVTVQGRADDEPKVLNVYNWSDYIGDDTIANFEKETGIKVHYDLMDSNEILHAKMVAGKTGYDIVVAASNWAKLEIDGGLIQKLDKSKIPNLKDMDPTLQAAVAKADPGNEHLVIWAWGYSTIGINPAKVKAALGDLPMPDNEWDLLFDPKYVSRLKSCGVSFFDSPSDVIPPALAYVGRNPWSKDPADYAEAAKMLAKVRPYVTLFSSSGYINDMANGSLCVALGWNGDLNIARKRAQDAKNGNVVEALVPKKGGFVFFSTMAIPADAQHPGNAHKWINYILRPEVNAGITNKVFYATPNVQAAKFVRPDIRQNKSVYPDAAAIKAMVQPQPPASDIRRLMTRTYTQFKTGE